MSFFSKNNSKNVIFPQKFAVIIDGGYWDKIEEHFCIEELDILKFCDSLGGNSYRFRTYYFDGKSTKRQSLHDKLAMMNRFEVILGDVVDRPFKCQSCGKTSRVQEQKRVDVLLAVQLVHLATTKQVDAIYLIAGDRDFLPAVEVAKQAGVLIFLVYLISKDIKTASGLLNSVDERLHLSKGYLEKFIQKDQIIRKITKEISIKNNDQKEIIDKDTKEEVISCLKELSSLTASKKISASILGAALKKRGMYYKKLNKFIEKLDLEIIQVTKTNTDLLFQIKEIKKAKDEETSSKNEELGVKFLLEVILMLEEEKSKKDFSMNEIATKINLVNPTWKKDFKLPKNKSLTNLILRSKDYLVVKGENNQKTISIKK